MTIIAAIILFGVLIFIHELGHFLFAKKAGVTIHEFSIGMGPKLFSVERGGTKYSVRLLPLGGYVSMEGEDEESKDPNSFGKKTILQRASILIAGPFFNIILAILLLVPVYMSLGIPSNENVLGKVIENTPAYEVGLKANDKVIEINEQKITTWEDIVKNIHKSDGNEINLKISRDNQTKDIKIKPQKNEQGNYAIGIMQTHEKGVFLSIKYAFVSIVDMSKQMFMFVGQLITGTVPGGAGNAVAGPIGVIGIVSNAAKVGIVNLLQIAAVISLNLGILNLLPIPALDGGRLLFLGIEAIRGGKKLDPNKEATINLIGFALLMALMIFVTFKDITRLF